MQTQPQTSKNFEELKFVNTCYNNLRIEKGISKDQSRTPRKVVGYHFSDAYPRSFQNPEIVALSKTAFDIIGLEYSEDKDQQKDNIDYLIGNKIHSDSKPMAHCYCGHQFGHFAGQLGDGRAILLGDVQYNGTKTELQFKGSGMTPYSRSADGHAVLRSSIREFLCSEHLAALGVPTTRALSQMVSKDTARRDPKYNGNVIDEKCAVVIRMAESFIRFGSFEVCLDQGPNKGKDKTILKELLDFTQSNYYPQKSYLEMLQEICRRTAEMVALWQCTGFCHGVMNTDNQSILGLTIDYGPFGFMEHFDEFHICNTSDEWGRYAYKQQPMMCDWNLRKQYKALVNVLDEKTYESIHEFHNNNFQNLSKDFYYKKMSQKLGLLKMNNDQKTRKLIDDLFKVMDYCRSDMTLTFKCLEKFDVDNQESSMKYVIKELILLSPKLETLQNSQKPKDNFLNGRPDFQKVELVKKCASNPEMKMSLAYMIGSFPEEYFSSIQDNSYRYNDFSKLTEDQVKNDQFNAKWSEWLIDFTNILQQDKAEFVAADTGDASNQWKESRLKIMKDNNPYFILRNYLIENAIKLAEAGDYSDVNRLQQLSTNPFDDNVFLQDLKPEDMELKPEVQKYCQIPPAWAGNLCLSCSS